MRISKFLGCIGLMILILCLAACGETEDAPTSDNYVRVVFRVYMPSSQVESRADSEPTEAGEDWEYAIDRNRLHVVFYDKDGKSIGGVERLKLVATTNKNEYQVSGSIAIQRLNLSEGGFSGKVMVYANIDGVDERADFTEANTQKLTFPYRPGHHYIPMWGVKQLDNIPFQAGEQYDIKTINLLRAEAKVQVSLREDMVEEGYTLTRVTLDHHNLQGYCLPSFSNIRNLADANSLTHETMANFLASGSTEELDLTKGPVYVPEYQNATASRDAETVTPAVIHLTLKNRFGESKDYQLKFVDYDQEGAPTGAPFDIIRNHDYQYEVYRGKNDVLRVKLTVRNWHYVEHENITM